ncbi:hypothetical protein K1719_001876 [Acacia pycnantha]|nr:hypothetical protein K1719_001876 [Acacia pycnantha]
MDVGDNDHEAKANAQISRGAIDKVEEKMRDCFKKNKWPLSPSTEEDGFVGRAEDFDAHAMRLRALDLLVPGLVYVKIDKHGVLPIFGSHLVDNACCCCWYISSFLNVELLERSDRCTELLLILRAISLWDLDSV